MENVQAIAVIIGIVNGIQLFEAPNKKGFIYFVVALVTGVVLGLLGMFGLNLEQGIVTALASSGLYKVAQKVGGY